MRWWSGWLQHALVIGCAVSMLVSGRLSVRLIADGAISFAFVPFFQALALAVVLRTGQRPVRSWRVALHRFAGGNRPWLVWLAAVTLVAAIVPPRQIGPWIPPLAASTVVPAAWSAILDFRFFRDTNRRSAREAIRDVVMHRAVAWTGVGVWFFGIDVWAEVLPRVAAWGQS